MAIKLLDPNAIHKLVSVSDDAIDLELTKDEDFKAYGSTLDISKLKFKKEIHPTYFLVRNIDPLLQTEINEKHYALIPPSVDKDGNKVSAKVDVMNRAGMMVKYFMEAVKEIEDNGVKKVVEIKQIPFDILQEIGSYAMILNTLGDKLKKN